MNGYSLILYKFMQQFYDKLGAEEKMSLCYTGNQNVGDFKCSAHV